MPKPDTYATEFIPAWAVQCWSDDEFVYCAIPSKAGPPLIQKFALTEGGMTKAINTLRVQRRTLSKGRVHKQSSPPITRYEKPRPLNDRKRELVRAALRKAGIIG